MTLFDLAAKAARQLDPETAHILTIKGLKRMPIMPASQTSNEGLEVTLPRSGLKLANPIGLAAGFDKNAEVFVQMLKFGFGFVECGTVTPLPQPGNPRPRLFRLSEDKAVINRMGFNNEGLDPFVRRLKRYPSRIGPVGANVGANKASEDRIADYVKGVSAVWDSADYITINISSPNTPGLRGLQDKGMLEDLLGRVGEAALMLEKANGKRPIFLKVAPDLDDAAISEIVEVVKAAPYLHGVIVSNTTIARPETLKSSHKAEAGGLSGKPLFEASTEVLKAFATPLRDEFDIIGVGGISSAEDVMLKLDAGAHAVQLYSAMAYTGPSLVREIKRDLRRLFATSK